MVQLPTAGSGMVAFRLPSSRSLKSQTSGRSGLYLSVTIILALGEQVANPVDRRWQASPAMYEYRLADHIGRELLVYHWQPGPRFLGPDHPHLHVSAALDAQVDAVTRREIGLDKLHIATGVVSLAVFVRMLITEFGVAPLRHDWRETLDRVEAETVLDREV